MAGFEDKELVKRMCNTIKHRGPDDQGIFSNDNVTLGNRRLSVIDLEGGHQPIHNEEESVWVTYNGEIYNYQTLRTELEKLGHSFYTRSDTEVIVHLYEEFGENFTTKLRGMFAFALWDIDTEKLILARDGRGIKPLYYTNFNEGIIFASEIKSILECGIKRSLNLKAVDQFLSYRFVFGSDTMFEGVKSLLPGSLLLYEGGKAVTKNFLHLRVRGKLSENEKIVAEKLKKLLDEAVQLRLISDVPLGVFLSGGIDSTSIVGSMSVLVDDPVKTFTVGFDDGDEDFKKARLVAEYFGTDHHELIVDFDDMTKKFPKMIWHLDEPVADPAIVPFYFVSKLARNNVKVSLVGEGADELFGGYLHHKLAFSYANFLPEILKRKILMRLNAPSPINDRRFLLGNTENHIEFKKFFDKAHNSYDFLDKILLWEIRNVLPKFQLMRVDKITMAHSLEARVPYLDPKLIEYAVSIPNNLKLKALDGKYILKKAVKKSIPKPIIKSKKRIFTVPLRTWFREGLGEMLSYLYDSTMSEDRYLNREHIHKIINRKSARNSHFYHLWSLLMLELWYRIFIKEEKSWKFP